MKVTQVHCVTFSYSKKVKINTLNWYSICLTYLLEGIGKTTQIANQCGRLVVNAIIYYNSALLSSLLEKYQKDNNSKAIEKILKISPVAWQHIHLLGHYTFCSNKNPIDLDKIISDLVLE